MRFQNKVCIVAGGGSGIGRATCIQLAQEGGQVVVIDMNEKSGMETADLISKTNGSAIFVKADIANTAEIEQAVQTAVSKWNKVDVLVNNAAMMTFKPILELSVEEWDKVMAVNLKSVFLFCKFCLPHMTGGAIVNVSSVHAHQTTVNVIPYATSKGGIEAFTRGMSREYQRDKTRINCVAPGADMSRQKFMFATGIENSYPTISMPDGSTKQIDEMEKSGHYLRWKEDFDLVKELGIEFLRYGPTYYRAHIGPDQYGWTFGDETFGRLKELRIYGLHLNDIA